jgi:hypothetical protein
MSARVFGCGLFFIFTIPLACVLNGYEVQQPAQLPPGVGAP